MTAIATLIFRAICALALLAALAGAAATPNPAKAGFLFAPYLTAERLYLPSAVSP